jgi:hypothetical protein
LGRRGVCFQLLLLTGVGMTVSEVTKTPLSDGAESAKRQRLLNKSRDVAALRLENSLKGMLDKADDALFEMAEKSSTDATQRVYFDAMRRSELSVRR